MGCITWVLVLMGGIFLVLSLIRWFEQATEAVRNRWWNKTVLLVVFPPSVWFFPSRIAAGRPSPVPLHDPVRGFGSLPKVKPLVSPEGSTNQPPPGTPPEFLVKPQVPPPGPKTNSSTDPEKLAQLRKKMRDQGMLDDL